VAPMRARFRRDWQRVNSRSEFLMGLASTGT
jgi:hypothetical protein